MSKPKKAGKKAKAKKQAPRKVVRRTAPRPLRVAAPTSSAPTETSVAKVPPEYPWNVLVVKGAEKLPVTVTDEAHLKRLVDEFGAGHVEVQS